MSPDVENTIVNALRTAASAYLDSAKASGGAPSIFEQFKRQSLDAKELADRIEAEGLRVIVYRECPE